MASAEVAMAKAKATLINNLIIAFPLCVGCRSPSTHKRHAQHVIQTQRLTTALRTVEQCRELGQQQYAAALIPFPKLISGRCYQYR